MSAIVYVAGEAVTMRARGSAMTFKAIGEQTGQAFSFMEREVPAGATAPPPHIHEGPEGFYVLEGELTFDVDGERTTVGSSGFVLVPGGDVHTFSNKSSESARVLIIHAPAADRYFADLQELWSGPQPPEKEQVDALLARHGMRPA